MSTVIRLSRTGKKGERKFRIVVKEKRSKRDGKAIDTLGWYQKDEKSEKKTIDMDRINYWLSRGAKLSHGVSEIVKSKK